MNLLFQAIVGSPPYILSALLGFFLAYAWTLAGTAADQAIRRRFGQSSFMSLIAGGVVSAALLFWRIPITPSVGICYILGVGLAICIAWRRILADHCTSRYQLPPHEQQALYAIVKRTLFYRGQGNAEAEAEKFLQTYDQSQTKRCADAASALHSFMHALRDKSADFIHRQFDIYDDFFTNHGKADRVQKEINALYVELLRDSLPHLIRTFEAMIGHDRQLWINVRAIAKTDNGNVYRTILRLGLPTDDRDKETVDIPESLGLPNYLREQYKANRGVIILNDDHSKRNWHHIPGDRRRPRQDKSTIAGPIFQKNINPSPMIMMLCINSPNKDVFTELHIPFFKCALDALSLSSTLLSTSTPLVLTATKHPVLQATPAYCGDRRMSV